MGRVWGAAPEEEGMMDGYRIGNFIRHVSTEDTPLSALRTFNEPEDVGDGVLSGLSRQCLVGKYGAVSFGGVDVLVRVKCLEAT